MLLVDPTGRVLAANARATALFGPLAGRGVEALREDGFALVASALSATTPAAPVLHTREAVGPGGSPFSAVVSVSATPGSSTQAAIIAVRDLTERRGMEAAVAQSLREPLQASLPGVEAAQRVLPFPVMDFGRNEPHKLFGIITNRNISGDELIHWQRARCGKSEEAHAIVKSDLAGGQLPSGKFGANAAWWAMMVLAFNLNAIMRKHALGGKWAERRMKRLRLGFIGLAGWVVDHARQLEIRLSAGHPALRWLARARITILSWLQVSTT